MEFARREGPREGLDGRLQLVERVVLDREPADAELEDAVDVCARRAAQHQLAAVTQRLLNRLWSITAASLSLAQPDCEQC